MNLFFRNGIVVLGKIAALIIFVITCSAHAQIQPPKGYVLQFKDDFTGGTVDATRWNYRRDNKALSAQLAANVSQQNGKLIVAPKKQKFDGKEFTGGGLVSKAAFRYGYFQVEAQTVGRPGWHSAFWAMTGDGTTTHPADARTEIDDFEINSAHPEIDSMGLLIWNGDRNLGSTRCNGSYKPGFDTSAGMHTYAFEWTEDGISYFLDGKMICSQSYRPTAGTHDRLHIWLTALGFQKPIEESVEKPLIFAHLRYYIRDYYIDAGDPGYSEFGQGWKKGTSPGYSNLGTRSSCSPDAIAIWAPTILQDGNYDVRVWETGEKNSSAEATIIYKGGEIRKRITESSSDAKEHWFDLGTFAFAGGNQGYLLLRPRKGACLSASMVKFVRQ